VLYTIVLLPEEGGRLSVDVYRGVARETPPDCRAHVASASLTSLWIQESISSSRTVTTILRIADGGTMKMGILTTTAPGAKYLRVSVFDFTSDHGDHPSSSRTTKEPDSNGSALPVRRHGRRPLSRQFSCCYHQESFVSAIATCRTRRRWPAAIWKKAGK
jgi:hypothetical protein